jgi:protoporphyrinogen/coproporphyrinogen III oxidase
MSQKIIVVGAGVSGIAAGVELKQRGYDVTLLDKNDYIGGKVRTVTKDGFSMETGASILPSKYSNIINRLNAMGLSHLLQPGGSLVGFARGNQIHCLDSARMMIDGITTKLISWPSKLLMMRMMLDNMRISPKLSYEDGSLAAEFDVETAAAYCDRRLNAELKEYIVDATLRGMLGTQAEINSVIDFFFSYNNVIGSKLYSMKNGMGTLPHAIVDTAGLKIELNTQVNEVVERNGRVSVSYTGPNGERDEEVDGVVMTLQATQVHKLLPTFGKASLDFLRSVKYTTAISVNLPLSSPPPNQKAFVIQIPKSVHPDLFAIVLDHNKAPGRTPPGKGMASLYAMSTWSEKLYDMDDKTVVNLMLAAAEQVMPGLSNKVEFSNVNRWRDVIVYSEPGLYRETSKFIKALDPKSRIKLGGDYFSCSNMNTAFAGGERAARELAQTLSTN